MKDVEVATEEGLEYEYEEITATGVVLRERRAGYSTHGYDFDDATGTIIGCALDRGSSWACC